MPYSVQLDYLAMAEKVVSPEYWDYKLKPSTTNPFPLAPRDLVRMRLIKRSDYRRQVVIWRSTIKRVIQNEMSSVIARMITTRHGLDYLRNMFWEVGGWGTGRERLATKILSQSDFQVIIRDISTVACGFATTYAAKKDLNWIVENGDVIRAWENGYVDEIKTFAVLASQLVQIFDQERMSRIMQAYGAFVTLPMLRGCPHRRVYLVHPLRSDNSTASAWGKYRFVPEWGDTTPYSLEELQKEAQRGAGFKKVRLHVLTKFMHFHQKYSVIRLMAQ